nr:salivary lipocalin-like [Meriones unguiculatus]
MTKVPNRRVITSVRAFANLEEDSKLNGTRNWRCGVEQRVRAAATSISPQQQLALSFSANEECVDHYVVADETETGEYSVEYDGHNKFTLFDADPGAYAIFDLTNFKDGKSFNLVALYAREPDVSQEIKNKFEELREKHGIPKENMVDLTQAVGLIPERVLVPTLQIPVATLEKEETPDPPVLSGDFSPGLQHHPFLSTHHPATSSHI